MAKPKKSVEYCIYCAKPLVKEWTGLFDWQTGRKTYRLVCPVEPCKHTLHDFKLKPKPFLILFSTLTLVCSRCGFEGYYE